MGRELQILRNEKEEMGDERGVDGTTNSKETKEEKRGKRVLLVVSITNHNLIFLSNSTPTCKPNSTSVGLSRS